MKNLLLAALLLITCTEVVQGQTAFNYSTAQDYLPHTIADSAEFVEFLCAKGLGAAETRVVYLNTHVIGSCSFDLLDHHTKRQTKKPDSDSRANSRPQAPDQARLVFVVSTRSAYDAKYYLSYLQPNDILLIDSSFHFPSILNYFEVGAGAAPIGLEKIATIELDCEKHYGAGAPATLPNEPLSDAGHERLNKRRNTPERGLEHISSVALSDSLIFMFAYPPVLRGETLWLTMFPKTMVAGFNVKTGALVQTIEMPDSISFYYRDATNRGEFDDVESVGLHGAKFIHLFNKPDSQNLFCLIHLIQGFDVTLEGDPQDPDMNISVNKTWGIAELDVARGLVHFSEWPHKNYHIDSDIAATAHGFIANSYHTDIDPAAPGTVMDSLMTFLQLSADFTSAEAVLPRRRLVGYEYDSELTNADSWLEVFGEHMLYFCPLNKQLLRFTLDERGSILGLKNAKRVTPGKTLQAMFDTQSLEEIKQNYYAVTADEVSMLIVTATKPDLAAGRFTLQVIAGTGRALTESEVYINSGDDELAMARPFAYQTGREVSMLCKWRKGGWTIERYNLR